MSKKLWFRSRSYGWGWWPASIEGWVVMVVWLLAVVATAYFIDFLSSSFATLLFVALMFLYTGTLIFIAWKKGERPVWRWAGEQVPASVAFTHAFGLVFFVLTAECAGALGIFFTLHAIPEWYVYLNKPFFSPPNWLFGPVWAVLYFLMGSAGYLVWIQETGVRRGRALIAYVIQLLLNALWTPIFFGLKNPILGLVVIASLLVMILITMYRFSKVDKIALTLFVPYLLWVAFATALNLSIVILN